MAKRAEVASTARDNRARLLAALYRRLDADTDFKAALASLIPLAEAAVLAHGPVAGRSRIDLVWLSNAIEPTRVRSDVPEVNELAEQAKQLVSRFGLDRLGPEGLHQVLAWLDRYLRARSAGLAPDAYGIGTLSTVRTSFAFEPEVFGIVSAPWQSEEWAPLSESREAARRRLERRARDHIKWSLDAIARETETQGLVHPRSIPNLQRDVDWLYQKLRGASFEEIYNGVDPPPQGGTDTVRKAVLRAAKRLGINSKGWETGWR